MKLLAAICAMANAAPTDWPGQNEGPGGTCGSTGMVAGSSVNSTCTIDLNGYTAVFLSIPGSFPLSGNTYTGFDGISSSTMQNFVVFWEEFEVDGEMDNSTCGTSADVSITCVDNGSADATPNLIQNFVSDPRQTDFQVGVMNHDGTFGFDASAFSPTQNSTCDATGDVFACDASGENGDLWYFGFTGAAGVSNF